RRQRDLAGSARGVVAVAQPARLEAAEVVGEALAPPVARERQDRPVARAGQLLELGLGLLEAAGGDVGGLGAKGERLVLVDAGKADPDPAGKRGDHLVGGTEEG